MDPINIFLVIIILSNLLLVIVASFGYQKEEEKGLVYKVYLVNIATIIWWLGSTILFRISDSNSIYFHTKNMYVSASLIASSFYYFSCVFPNYTKVQLRRLLGVILLNLGLVLLIIFSDNIIHHGIVNDNFENEVVFGGYFWIYTLYILYYFSTSFGRLFIKYKNEGEPIKKSQLLYMFFGYSISGSIAFIADLALPIMGNFNFLWLGPAATICVATFVTFAIKRHKLFSMKILAVEFIVFTLWIFAAIRISVFIDTPRPVIDVLYLVVTIFIGALFIQSVKRESAQREINEELVVKLKEADELKTRFVSLATHHMASPLTSMKVYSEFLKDGGVADKDMGIENIADNFISIVRDFLDISKLEEKDTVFCKEIVSIVDVVNLVIGVCSTKLKRKEIMVSFENLPNLYVVGDKDKLSQALINIIENCIKYSKEGSSIDITAYAEGDFVCISIKDSVERVLPKTPMILLKKFSNKLNQKEADIVGSSLGLYSAKQIIEKLGGEFIIVDDVGTNFYIYLKRSNL